MNENDHCDHVLFSESGSASAGVTRIGWLHKKNIWANLLAQPVWLKSDHILNEMRKITISNQSHKSYRKHKSENGRTRTSEYIRGGIRCHGGVSIPCWPVAPANTLLLVSDWDRLQVIFVWPLYLHIPSENINQSQKSFYQTRHACVILQLHVLEVTKWKKHRYD
jgi:hypothetical protein